MASLVGRRYRTPLRTGSLPGLQDHHAAAATIGSRAASDGRRARCAEGPGPVGVEGWYKGPGRGTCVCASASLRRASASPRADAWSRSLARRRSNA